MKTQIITVILFSLLLNCKKEKEGSKKSISNTTPVKTEKKKKFQYDSLYISHSFDFPVGKPDAKGYYNAQKFQENFHLGDDWNAVTGQNTDLGDPIFSIANGYVVLAKDYGGGWGNVIRVIHKMTSGTMVESLYAHCDTILVNKNQWVKKGQKIGTIGTANGQYFAHLHLEIRDDLSLPIGFGYSNITNGYLNPTEFIKNNR